MNPQKTGALISKLRCDKQLTQNELAEKLGVTDKAISKWECGNGLPDITMLEPLAKELDTSVAELLNGETCADDVKQEQADKAIVELLKYTHSTSRRTLGALLVIFGALMILMLAFSITGEWFPYAFVFGIAAIVVGIILLTVKKSFVFSKIPKQAAQWITFGALIAAIVLEALPYGVVMIFATDPEVGQKIVEQHSYFNFISFAYGYFSPITTATLTIVLAVLSLVANLVRRKATRLRNAQFIITLVATIISIAPAFYGYEYVTVIGVAITLLLAISSIFCITANAKIALE